jgi:hypothetical protein
MMVRRRMSYATLMATIAVFVALGGTSYVGLTLRRLVSEAGD